MRVVDFYTKVTEVFNNPDYVPVSKCLPELHDDFKESFALPLNEYRLTRERAKDILTFSRPKLASVVARYELSGAGAGQKRKEKVITQGGRRGGMRWWGNNHARVRAIKGEEMGGEGEGEGAEAGRR